VLNFASVAGAVAELAHGEKSRTQSINQSINQSLSASLFDAPGTEAFDSD